MIARDTLVYRTLVSMARQRPGLDEPRCRAVLELLATADALRTAMRHNVALLGVSELQFSVLLVLLTVDPLPCTPALLADHTCVSRSAITEALDRAEERKWITRQRSREDRRTYFIALTDLGRNVIDQLAPSVLRQMAELAHDLVGAAPQRLRQLCSRLGENPGAVTALPPAKIGP